MPISRPETKTGDRPRPDAGALVPLAHALAGLKAVLGPAPAAMLPLDQAIGRVLAEPLVVPADVPAQAVALRRGYAVRAADLVGASPYAPAWLDAPLPLVAVGQTLPPGADAVLPPEAAEPRGGGIEITQAVAVGHDIRRIAEDAARGARLCQPGRILTALDAACARAAGLTEAAVRPVRLSIMAAEGDPCAALIAAAAQGCGALVDRVEARSFGDDGALGDEPARMMVVATDDGPGILRRADETIAAAVAIRPGDAAACARIGRSPVLVVPARLDAALAACLLILIPCLDHLAGAAPRASSPAVRLTRKVSSALGLTEIVLLKAAEDGLEPIAVGDLSLAAMAAADAWIAVPAEAEGYAEGSLVRAVPLRRAFA